MDLQKQTTKRLTNEYCQRMVFREIVSKASDAENTTQKTKYSLSKVLIPLSFRDDSLLNRKMKILIRSPDIRR